MFSVKVHAGNVPFWHNVPYRLAINWLLSLSFLNVSVLWWFFDSLWQLDAYTFTDLGNLAWIWRDYCNIGIKDCVFRPQKTTETIFVLHLEAWLLAEKIISSENRKTEKKRNVSGRKARRSESDSFYQKLQQWVFDLLLVWTVKHNFPSLFISREPFSRWLIYNFFNHFIG